MTNEQHEIMITYYACQLAAYLEGKKTKLNTDEQHSLVNMLIKLGAFDLLILDNVDNDSRITISTFALEDIEEYKPHLNGERRR